MLLCMRTTLDLPDALFRRAKQAAAREGLTLRALVVRALTAYLGGKPAAPYRFDWHVDHKPWNAALPLHSRGALEEYLGGWRADLYG
jgi:hypothetical protein